MAKSICYNCMYIEPLSGDLKICKCESSPYYNKNIVSNNSCTHFLNNPAQSYFRRGRDIYALEAPNEEEIRTGINDLKKALELGLPPRDEVICLIFLADACFDKDDVDECLEHADRAFEVDALNTKNFGEKYVSPINTKNPIRFFFFDRPQRAYAIKSVQIYLSDGIEAAISFLKEKINLVNFLDGTNMPLLYSELGRLYKEQGKKDLAVISYKKSLEADNDFPDELEESEISQIIKEVHNEAWDNIRLFAEDSDVLDNLKNQKKHIKKDIHNLKQEVEKTFKEIGFLMYPQLAKNELAVKDNEIHESVKHIKAIDNVIDNYNKQINGIKSQKVPNGFMSRLKAKAGSTLKTSKIQLDIRGLKKKKEEAYPILGKKLYDYYVSGKATIAELQEQWKIIDKLKGKIKGNEEKYVFLEEVLQTLKRR